MLVLKRLLPVFLLLTAIAICPAAFAQTSFDIPGATEIYPITINSSGTVAGYFATTSPSCCPTFGKDFYGFLRDPAGNITTFSTAAPYPNNSLTVVEGMNNSGTVVGFSYWVGAYNRGFIRSSNGNITVISLSGAIGNTEAWGINDNGDVTGNWFAQNPPFQSHGFIVSGTGGTYISFDVPNPSKSVTTLDTDPVSINLSGEVAGTFVDSNNTTHIFLRNAKGHFTTYDIAGSLGIIVTKINDSGVIGGRYTDASGTEYGFTQTTRGKKVLATFAYPGSTTVGTDPNDLNSNGDITGAYYDGSAFHGFLLDSGGNFSPLDVPGATETYPLGLNDNTPTPVTTGYYFDSMGAAHGFVW